MKMRVDKVKLILALTVFLTIDHCVCDDASLVPRIMGPKGNTYRNFDIIFIFDGQPLELYCRGKQVKKVTETGSKIIRTVKNEMTIRIYERNPNKNERVFYHCYYNESYLGSSSDLAIVEVLVVPYPAVKNFHCKLNDTENLNCTWEGDPEEISLFTLYYENYNTDDQVRLLCKVDYTALKYCVLKYSLNFSWKIPVYIIVETCNIASCANQTFPLSLSTIIELNPPEIYIKNKTSHSAFLKLRESLNYLGANEQCKYLDDCQVEYRINYWYSGISSKANTTFLLGLDDAVNDIELKFPCSDQFYEVKIAVKLSTAEEEFWSDDAVAFIVTDSESEKADDTIVDDVMCHHEQVKITPEIMQFKLGELKSKVKAEQKHLQESIRSLKLKLGEINKR